MVTNNFSDKPDRFLNIDKTGKTSDRDHVQNCLQQRHQQRTGYGITKVISAVGNAVAYHTIPFLPG